jgi:hypothetical protein
MQKIVYILIIFLQHLFVTAQVKWINVDSSFTTLLTNFHIYKTIDSLDGKPFMAYYAEADLKDRPLLFTTDRHYL